MRIGMNGFGRIGRLFLRSALERGVNLDIVAINDRGDAEINAHLFQFDSTYGPFRGRVKVDDERIIINDRSISPHLAHSYYYLQEPDRRPLAVRDE